MRPKYRIAPRSRKMRGRLTWPKSNRAGQLALPGPTVPPGERRPADGRAWVRSGDLGELLGRDLDAAGQRREGVVGERHHRLGVLRAGRNEHVEVAAQDLALELEQLGRALDRGQLLHVGGQRLVGRLGLLDISL